MRFSFLLATAARAFQTARGGGLRSGLSMSAVEKFRADYKSLPYGVESVNLNFDIKSESSTYVTSKLRFVGGGGPLELDGEDLKLVSLRVDGEPVEYELTPDGLKIATPPPAPFELETVVEIDPKANTQLSGLYASSGNLCTQCEAEGFRRITYFYDRPDVMSKYTVRVEADKDAYPVLLSNGNEVGKGVDGDRHWATFEDPFNKPSYLFALVAGDLGHIEDTFTTMSGRQVRLFVWSEHHNVGALDWAMHSLKTSMKWDEDRYGREYDLDVYHIVAVSDFNMGAMENKGLNVFNTACVLAKETTATDGDYERVLGVVAHEYFHNWSGNRVTCRDWFQLTLKEGLTVFRDQHFSEELTSPAAKRIEDIRIIRSSQFTQDASPMSHPIRPESYVAMDNFYTVTVYNKGAEVIRMYRTLLGEGGFRKGMDLYFERHDGEAVTCDDFRAAMADANGKDLTQFEEWYKQAGTPTIKVTERGVKDGAYRLTLTQSNGGKPPLHVPIKAALVAPGGAVAETLFELTDESKTFEFPMAVNGEPYVPSLLRGFSAPVKLSFEPPLSIAELESLAAYDDDAFVKWDSWQQLAARVVLDKYHGAQDAPLPDYLVNAFKATLTNGDEESSLRAYSLDLPDYSTLALELEDLDPTKLCDALKATRLGLATAARAELEACYAAMAPADDTFSLDAAAVGRRRLRNTCLAYLSKLDGGDALCGAHFDAATCMSDSIAPVAQLASKPDSNDRARCLEAFYDKAKKNQEDLVINKWFAIQAMADCDGAIDNVSKLLEHPDFTDTNPNRFRAVVNTFALGNPRHFHSGDGKGYDFIADQICSIDKKNPQVAARLSNAFGSWRRYEPSRRDLMRQALERIKVTAGLSKDTLEIVSRSLV
ncbi:hypothetical protein CTAYLR_008707 [Chrysophaeum taylorii]|uniref:Aminopeptidase N n=1 Tax=Chrysophaeum taylorii TaxID=2483200 RepID=A0AAD7ULQ7_9STRA|nr:hypothetical protein CTAYLR_008707 [Chrysophaeum taylorii]